jgi:hypothetical protein
MRHLFKYVKINKDVILAEVPHPSGRITIEDIKQVVERHGKDLIVEKSKKNPIFWNCSICASILAMAICLTPPG